MISAGLAALAGSWATAQHIKQAFGVGRLEQAGGERAVRGQPGHGDVRGDSGGRG